MAQSVFYECAQNRLVEGFARFLADSFYCYTIAGVVGFTLSLLFTIIRTNPCGPRARQDRFGLLSLFLIFLGSVVLYGLFAYQIHLDSVQFKLERQYGPCFSGRASSPPREG